MEGWEDSVMYKLLVISTDGDKRVCIDAEYSTCDHEVSLAHDCFHCYDIETLGNYTSERLECHE